MKKRFVLLLLLLATYGFANTPGQHSVSLTWSESDASVVNYNVYRGLATGVCTGTPTPYASSTTKSYTDTAVTAGTTYFYAVSAVNGSGGESACSNEAQATVPTSPSVPTNLQLVSK